MRAWADALARCGAGLGVAALVAACGGASGAVPAAEFVVAGGEHEATFEGPEELPGGVVEIRLANDGDSPHNLQLIRVDGGRSAAAASVELQKAITNTAVADWFHAGGGVPAVEPGETGTVTQTLRPDATYYGFDDEIEGGRQEAVVAFETGDAGAAELPDADATITARDYSFEAEGLHAGENVVRFDNRGEQWHHVVAHPLGEGGIDEITGYFQQESPQGAPPIPEDENAVYSTVIEGGAEQNLEMTLAPGRYALLCFVANREGGLPHVALGMAREVEVE